MADEEVIHPSDVSVEDSRRILDFLNRAGSAEEIADAVEFPGDRDIGIRLSQRILAQRAHLDGTFTELQQVLDIEGIGPKRFTQIVKALRTQTLPSFDPEKVREARDLCEAEFLRRDGILAVAVGFRKVGGEERPQEICVKVFVASKRPIETLSVSERLPQTVPAGDGTPVLVDVEPMEMPVAGGMWRCSSVASAADAASRGLRGRVRPAMGGYSVGHFRVTAGTIATVVRDRNAAELFYILSNNHILANSNQASFGDAVLQPGVADGGVFPRDVIARLCRCIPIDFSPGVSNLVDAAVAQVCFCDVERRVYSIGYPRSVLRQSQIHLNQQVQKTGRTTGFTRGRVIALNGTVNVGYPGGRVARFRDQIFTTAMSEGGDSGSLVLDLEGNAVGLLFAGSGTHTIMNAAEVVQDQLQVVIAERTL
jgi:hypothetical protein